MKEIIARAIIDSGLSIDFLQKTQNEYSNAPESIQILVLRLAEKITSDKFSAETVRNLLNAKFKLI